MPLLLNRPMPELTGASALELAHAYALELTDNNTPELTDAYALQLSHDHASELTDIMLLN
jgi:hypothetical protein